MIFLVLTVVGVTMTMCTLQNTRFGVPGYFEPPALERYNMDNEPYRTIAHNDASRELACHLNSCNQPIAREVKLPNGTIADIVTITEEGDVDIWEVKSEFRAADLAATWHKYHLYCNRLWLAVPNLIPPSHLWLDGRFLSFSPARYMGIAGIYPSSVAVIQKPTRHVVRGYTEMAVMQTFLARLTRG